MSDERTKFKPSYSGPQSTELWGMINKLDEPKCDAAYHLGCQIQELEARLAAVFEARGNIDLLVALCSITP